MGQKVHPTGMRLGIIYQSNSRWFPQNRSFSEILFEDICIRKYIRKTIPRNAAISNILIERTNQNIKITIKTAKPGVVIGKKGEEIDKLRFNISQKYKTNVTVGIEEIRKPELDSYLVAENIAIQLENRVLFRRAIKRAISNGMRNGAKGVKVAVSGRLGGNEIARVEWNREGRVPLHTFRADIDYGFAEAKTTYGIIGVKVWIFKGEILGGNYYQFK